MKKKELFDLLNEKNAFELLKEEKITAIDIYETIDILLNEKIEDMKADEMFMNRDYLQYKYNFDNIVVSFLTKNKEEIKSFAKMKLEKMARE